MKLGVPPQVVVAGPVATKPAGSVSTSGAVRLATVPLVLLSVMVSAELPPAGMLAGRNALASDGVMSAGLFTVNVATAGAALLPLLVCKAPGASSELT